MKSQKKIHFKRHGKWPRIYWLPATLVGWIFCALCLVVIYAELSLINYIDHSLESIPSVYVIVIAVLIFVLTSVVIIAVVDKNSD